MSAMWGDDWRRVEIMSFSCPTKCKLCGFQTRSFFRAMLHILIKHKRVPKKDDVSLAFRFSIEAGVLFYVLATPLMVIKGITFPFWWIHERL